MDKDMVIDTLARELPVCPHCHVKLDYLLVRKRFYEYHRVKIENGQVRTEIDDTEDLDEDTFYSVFVCPNCRTKLDLKGNEVKDFLYGFYPKRWTAGEEATRTGSPQGPVSANICPHCGAYLKGLAMEYDNSKGVVFRCPKCGREIADIDNVGTAELFLEGKFVANK